MTLKKRGTIWHFRFKHGGRLYQGSTGQTNIELARKYEAKFRSDLALARLGIADVPTMGSVWAAWWDAHQPTLSAAYLKRTEIAWRLHLGPIVSRIRVNAVDPAVVAEVSRRYLMTARVNGLASTLATLRAIVRWGCDQCGATPLRVAVPTFQEPSRPYLTQDEIPVFLAGIDSEGDPQKSLAVRMCLYMGLRISECMSLRFEWIRDRGHSIVIGHSKNRKSPAMPIPAMVRPWIWALHWGTLPDLGLMLPGQDGHIHSRHWLDRTLARHSPRPGISAHRLRGTFATLQSQAGVPLPVIQRMMRHRSLASTMRYIQVGAADLEKAMATVWSVQNVSDDPASTA